MAFKTSLGVAVEDERVALVYLKSALKGPKVGAQAVYSLEKDQPLEPKLAQAGERLREFLAQNRVSAGEMFLGLPRGLTIVRYVELPPAVKENLRETLQYELEKHVPFPAEDVHFDYQIVKEDKEKNTLTVCLVVVKKASLTPFLNLAKITGKGVAGIEAGCTALGNCFSVQSAPFGESGYALVFMEDKRLEVDFIEQNLLKYSRSVETDGQNRSLPELVQHEIDKLKRNLGLNDKPVNTALTGSAEAIEELEPLEQKDATVAIRSAEMGFSSPALIPAFGLALKGLREVPMNINLLPEELQKKAGKVGQYTMLILLGLGLLGIVAWGGGRIVQKKIQLKHLNAEIEHFGTKIEQMKETQSRLKDLEERLHYAAGLRDSRIQSLEILKELTQIIPETAWVRDLRYRNGSLRIEGYAQSASDLIALLEASPYFEEVAFLSRITRTRGDRETFRIGLKVISP